MLPKVIANGSSKFTVTVYRCVFAHIMHSNDYEDSPPQFSSGEIIVYQETLSYHSVAGHNHIL